MSCNSPIPDCIPCQDCPPSGVTYTLPTCPEGEKCQEVSKTDCVKYVGPNLPALDILNDDRLITVLTKLHKVVNTLKGQSGVTLQNYTATCTPPAGTSTPMVVRYLSLGPIYTSTPGALGAGTTITVGSTTGISVGMSLEVISGVGAFAAGTTVTTVVNTTSFTISAAPTVGLSGGATVIRGTGTDHKIFEITVLPNIPQTFRAFIGSAVKVSGTGTIV